jgi:hypothetical protein
VRFSARLRQIENAGDFEGQVTFGLGLRRKRASGSPPQTRIVIDVAR